MAFISKLFCPDIIALSNLVSRGVWVIKKHLLMFSSRLKEYFNDILTAETEKEKTHASH